MSYAHINYKLTFGGSIYGQEIWVNSINFGKETADVGYSGVDLSAYAESVAEHVSTWFSDARSAISPYAQLEWVKLAVISKEGLYVKEAGIYDLDTPVPGAYAGLDNTIAPQLSIAQTFTTSVLRGPGRFGRIYPPINAVSVEHTGKVAPTRVLGQAQATAKLLTDINTELGSLDTGVRAIVASKVGNGVNAAIRGVKVGDVVDTQRSRRNAFEESYSVTSLV